MNLQRRLTRTDALAIALGGVIGVGVFRTSGLVLVGSGGLLAATAMWLVIGAVCLSGVVLYADLSARVPEVGGPYAYVRVGFGNMPAFAYGWFNAGVAIPVRQASVMAVIGELLAGVPCARRPRLRGSHAGLADRTQPPWRSRGCARSADLHVRQDRDARVRDRAGRYGHSRAMDSAVAGTMVGLDGATFATAIAGVWYTYLGWQDVVLLAEEVQEPRRNLPFVLVATVATVIVLYTGLHVALYFGLGGGTAAASALPVAALAQHTLGAIGTTLIAVLMLSSMIGGAAEGLMVRPRMALALARDGFGPSWLTTVGRTGTPTGALLANSAVVLVLVSTGSFTELLPLLVFAQGLLGVFETTSYFAVRRLRPELPTSRFHPWAPLAFVSANVALCVVEGLHDPLRAGLALVVLASLAAGYALVRQAPVLEAVAQVVDSPPREPQMASPPEHRPPGAR